MPAAVDNNIRAFLPIEPQLDKAAPSTSPTTSRVQPHAQQITQPPAEQATRPSAALKPLAQRQARPAKSPPELVRQARYAAPPSVTQVASSLGNIGKVAQTKGLPSLSQLTSGLYLVKSHSYLDRLLSLFGLSKPTSAYQNIIAKAAAYDDACQAGTETAQEALNRLSQLAEAVEQYSQDGHRDPQGVIKSMREQLVREHTELTNLMVALKNDVLPQDISWSAALAWKHEGIDLTELQNLFEPGLIKDATQETEEISASGKLPADRSNTLSDFVKILGGLRQYHSVCDAHNIKTDIHSDLRVADQAMRLLNELSTSTQTYLKTNESNPQAEAIELLQDQVLIEHKVLQGVIDDLNDGGKLPKGTDLSHALAFAREGVSLKDMDRLITRGLLPTQAADARLMLESEIARDTVATLANQTPDQRAEAAQQRAETAQDFSDDELLLLKLSGLGLEGGDAYRFLGIPITRQTVILERTDEQRLDNRDMKVLGSGAVNTVYQARYSGPDGLVNGVFKPLSNFAPGFVAQAIGMDPNFAKIANRNLATQDVAHALGFDVLVDCQVGSRLDPDYQDDPSYPELELGLVMGLAPGKTAYDTSPEDYKHPQVRREITKLQLLDHLVGQGDRHGANYFIHINEEVNGQIKVKVSGIDNDQCFGEDTLNPEDLRFEDSYFRSGFRGTRMPPLIDTDMAAALRRITPEMLSAMLSDKLSEAEVLATHSRLGWMLRHVDYLEKNNRILTPEQWDNNTETTARQTKDNSYVVRDAEAIRVEVVAPPLP